LMRLSQAQMQAGFFYLNEDHSARFIVCLNCRSCRASNGSHRQQHSHSLRLSTTERALQAQGQ
jgi:hypothetical protein